MKPITTHERMTIVYEHREPDRVPITDWIWESTYARWRAEGLPADADWTYFGLDDIVGLSEDGIDTSPRFERYVIEETDAYRIEQDQWGVTKKNFKPVSTTPMYLDFAIRDRKTWAAARERMTPTRDRVNWKLLEDEYASWRERGAWIMVAPWFGWDIVNARTCGTERILYAMADDPAWPTDMFNHGCDLTLALLDMIWDEGYTFDELLWFDDMAYRGGMIFSKSRGL